MPIGNVSVEMVQRTLDNKHIDQLKVKSQLELGVRHGDQVALNTRTNGNRKHARIHTERVKNKILI